MVEGREFDMRDQRLDVTPSTVLPVVINQTAAHAFFGNADPLGRRISDSAEAPSAAANPMDPVVHAAGSGSGRSYTVVGVVKDLSAPMSRPTWRRPPRPCPRSICRSPAAISPIRPPTT